MTSEGYWNSVEGLEYQRFWREMTTARGFVATRPQAKGSRGAVQERVLIEAAVEEFAPAYRGGGWPRPRAEVALDVRAVGINNAPQPQNFAKRLLDQLGIVNGAKPIVYNDDRQVSMLFARVDEWKAETPSIHFTAQRSSVIRGEMRRHPRTDERREQHTERDHELEQRLEFAQDQIEHCRGATTSLGRKLYAMAVREQRYYLQASTLHTTDYLAQELVHQYAGITQRHRERSLELVAESLDLLALTPYGFNLGTLPGPGQTQAFKQAVREAVLARMQRYPLLFPPQIPIGVTAFYVPGPDGKDLDNIFRDLVVPVLLEHCHLPTEVCHPNTSFDEITEYTPSGPSRPAFIEGVALKGILRSPGTVVLALSGGLRYRSRWEVALDDGHDRDDITHFY